MDSTKDKSNCNVVGALSLQLIRGARRDLDLSRCSAHGALFRCFNSKRVLDQSRCSLFIPRREWIMFDTFRVKMMDSGVTTTRNGFFGETSGWGKQKNN
jgi:hypothetical protein